MLNRLRFRPRHPKFSSPGPGQILSPGLSFFQIQKIQIYNIGLSKFLYKVSIVCFNCFESRKLYTMRQFAMFSSFHRFPLQILLISYIILFILSGAFQQTLNNCQYFFTTITMPCNYDFSSLDQFRYKINLSILIYTNRKVIGKVNIHHIDMITC